MSEYRKWDESKSPQWKYLLQKEATQRRMTRKEIEKERRETEKESYKPKKKHSDYKRERKRGKNIVKYVRSGGVMRKVSDSTRRNEPNTIMEQVKDEYRTTQEVTTPQEQEQSRSKYSTIQERDT